MHVTTLAGENTLRFGSGRIQIGGSRFAIGLIAAIFIVKLGVAAMVPLVPDEAYYGIWSQDLAAGYLDHPPMIAYFIRAGTMLLGDSNLGVRLLSVLCGIPTTWFVWQSARSLIAENAGRLAAILFNVTLFGFLGLELATPDAPVTLFAAAMLYCTTRLEEDPKPIWWLSLGLATGLAMQSKYSAALLAVGLAAWVITDPSLRRKLVGPWPWLAVLVALVVFLPNLVWNYDHDWQTFAKQGGRVVRDGHLSFAFLPDLILGQVGLATPLIFLFGLIGLTRAASGSYRSPAGRRLVLFGLLVPMAYFVFHAARTKVEGNWPGLLYPILAVVAAGGMLSIGTGTSRAMDRTRRAVVPVAVALLVVVAIQASFVPVTAFGRSDPIIRMTRGWQHLAGDVDRLRQQTGSDIILTEDYQTNAELRRFIKDVPVEQWNEPERPGAIQPSEALRHPEALYIGSRYSGDDLGRSFGTVAPIATLTRQFAGTTITTLTAFRRTGAPTPATAVTGQQTPANPD